MILSSARTNDSVRAHFGVPVYAGKTDRLILGVKQALGFGPISGAQTGFLAGRPSAAERAVGLPKWRRVPAACGVGDRSYRAWQRRAKMESLTLVARFVLVEHASGSRNEARTDFTPSSASEFFCEGRTRFKARWALPAANNFTWARVVRTQRGEEHFAGDGVKQTGGYSRQRSATGLPLAATAATGLILAQTWQGQLSFRWSVEELLLPNRIYTQGTPKLWKIATYTRRGGIGFVGMGTFSRVRLASYRSNSTSGVACG
jgi:hypothetical protein